MAYALERKIVFFFITLLAGVFMFAFVSAVSAATTIGNNVSVGGTLAVTGVTTVSSDIDPDANNTIDLGAFATAYNDVFASGTVYAGVFQVDGAATFGGDLNPNANNTLDIGAFTTAFKDVFASGTVYAATSTVYSPTGTSTIYLSSGLANTGGRIILEEADGNGCMQIYFDGEGMVTSTITCP